MKQLNGLISYDTNQLINLIRHIIIQVRGDEVLRGEKLFKSGHVEAADVFSVYEKTRRE